MWKTILIPGTLAAAIASGPAAAMSPVTGGTEAAAPVQQQSRTAEAGSALNGMDVWSADGERLGEVATVNLDTGGGIRSIYIQVGTFLGLGSKTVEIAPEQFREYNGRIVLELDAGEVSDLPEVNAE